MQSRQAQLEQVAGLLARRLDERTLIVVLAQLLDADVTEVPQAPNVPAGEFRQLLGGIETLWYEWKRQGRIPPDARSAKGSRSGIARLPLRPRPSWPSSRPQRDQSKPVSS